MRTSLIALILLVASALPAQAIDRQAQWTDNSANETGFIVQRCPGICTAASTAWTQITVTPVNSTSFLITGALPGTTTSYRVGATNAIGTGWSPIVVDVLPIAGPSAPKVFTLPPCTTLTETAPGSGLYQCS